MTIGLAELPIELIELIVSYGKVEINEGYSVELHQISRNHRRVRIPQKRYWGSDYTRFVRAIDIITLRAVCRAMNEKTFRLFGELYFKRVDTTLRPESVRRLDNISRHEKLRHCVERLHIRERIPKPSAVPSREIGRGYEWNRNAAGCLEPTNPGPGMDALKDILVNRLINCRSFSMRRYYLEQPGKTDSLMVIDVMALILLIAAETGMEIRSFRMGTTMPPIMPMSTSYLHPARYQTPGFKHGWGEHLQELILNCTIESHTNARLLVDLIMAAKQLRSLSIHQKVDATNEHFLYLLLHSALPSTLQRLALEEMHINNRLLLQLLHSIRDRLRTLVLDFIILTIGDWSETLEQIQSMLPLLSEFNMRFLKWDDGPPSKVMFCDFTPFYKCVTQHDGNAPTWSNSGLFEWHDPSFGTFPEDFRITGLRYQGPHSSRVIQAFLANLKLEDEGSFGRG